MELLDQAYDQKKYLNFLADKFNFSKSLQAIIIENNEVESFEQLGFISTADNKQLPIFEIYIKPNTKLARNRVQLRNLVAKQIKTEDGALAVYVDENSEQWRFSFIAIEYELNENGIKKKQTASKRFTYLFGKGTQTRTAKERFELLNKKSSLEELKTAFAVEQLNKDFYGELYNWYDNAQSQVTFPNDEGENQQKHIKNSLIRLLTRLLFIWFLKEKHLINPSLFNLNQLKDLINWNKNSSFYKAILQNLFFATLNRKINERSFRTTTNGNANSNNYLATSIYRYQKYFTKQNKQDIMALFVQTPFLNGGLFECLDREATDEEKQDYNNNIRPVKSAIRIDGFSDKDSNELVFDNALFFNDDKNNLGLISLFEQYQFTVEESTPLDIEVALDPELLGKVFENLLASYNPETGEQARTGSFYTPRDIVSYMVDESLKQHFKTHTNLTQEDINTLFIEGENPLNKKQIQTIVSAINSLKILDPAVGSGAYPMGVLQKLVFILEKIDKSAVHFKQQQLKNLPNLSSIEQDLKTVAKINDQKTKEKAKEELEDRKQQIKNNFQKQNHNYLRKLHLIENCIYGVDIQAIAIQICKLRFFISLTIEQTSDKSKENYGIKALPNLETKFIVANTLLPLGEKPQQTGLFDADIDNLKTNLSEVRHQYFSAKTLKTKRKYRKQDKQLRQQMLETLKQSGISPEVETSMQKVVDWDLYNQNAQSDWFDPEWMFGVKEGFDIVIGNPPYISALDARKYIDAETRSQYKKLFFSATGAYDTYVLFFEIGIKTLKSNGSLHLITPSKFLSASYAKSLREFILKHSLLKISDFSTIKVFESANVSTISTLIHKDKTNQDVIVGKYQTLKNLNDCRYIISERKYLDFFPENTWGFLLSDNIKILVKIVNNSKILKEIASVNASSTASEADEYSSYISGSECDDCIKIINTGTIGNIHNFWGVKEIKNKGYKILRPFLNLTHVGNRRKSMYKSPKLIFKKLSTRIAATYDSKGEFASTNTNFIYNPDSEYSLNFLALYLNSKLMDFFYKQLFGGLFMLGSFQFQAPQLRILPIPKISETEQQPFIDLADKILTAKQNDKDTTDLEAKIDVMVYQLYNLTAAEIKIIEGEK